MSFRSEAEESASLPPNSPIRTILHLAAASTLLLGATSLHAQIIHSPQVNIHRHHAENDLSWILQYTQPAPDGSENQLVWDHRFEPFLKQNLTAPQSFWKQGQPLYKAALAFLGGPPGRVFLDQNRYLNADACVQHFCPDRGLLCVDTGLPQPLVVFTAIDWITENRATDDRNASYAMWVFPSQPIDPEHIPAALTHSIRRWTGQPSSGSTDLQNITRVFLVDPDGTPHTLAPATIGAHNTLPSETSNPPSTERSSDPAPKGTP